MRRLILAFSFLTVSARAQDRATLVSKLDSLAGAPVVEKRAVGISVTMLKGNDTLLSRGYGKLDIEKNVPMPPNAFFEIGSVTKQFTAAAILQLRDEGKVNLEDDISKYLPKFNTNGRKVTVRRLLDHTSGMRGITEIPEFRTLFNKGYPRDSALTMIERAPWDFAPGDAQIYNNSAFILLGHIIEKASGMSYEDYVEKRIFAPLGMRDSRYCNNSETVRLRAKGYSITPTETRPASANDHTWPYSAGSLCSTGADLMTWMKALHGGKVLTAKSYKEMTTPARLNDGTELRYGMGIAVMHDERGSRFIGHGGAIDGFTADARWYPDSNLYVVVLMNSSGPVSPSALASELAGAVIPPTNVGLTPFTGDGTPLIGKYTGPSRGRPMTVEIVQGPTTLGMKVNGGAARPLSWLQGMRFRQGNSVLTFERKGAAGPATLLRFDGGGGAYYMLRREQ
jgi:CubicO group peptidase (beta-lactamase class C family)